MIRYLIAPLVKEDALLELFASTWPNYQPAPFAPMLAHSLTYICAYRQDNLVGFVNVAWNGRSHAFILDTTVHGKFQRQGIGRELVQQAIRVAKMRGMAWLHVDFEPHLRPFYRSCGFEHTEAGLMQL